MDTKWSRTYAVSISVSKSFASVWVGFCGNIPAEEDQWLPTSMTHEQDLQSVMNRPPFKSSQICLDLYMCLLITPLFYTLKYAPEWPYESFVGFK